MELILITMTSLFPAHAGVILYGPGGIPGGKPVPRTRGGDPIRRGDKITQLVCSPHTRG